MSKDSYIEMRNKQQYNIEWFYAYYKENNGKDVDIYMFTNLFSMIDLNGVLDYLDHRYELSLLYGPDGNFIKVIN